MHLRPLLLAVVPALALSLVVTRTSAIEADPFWSIICTTSLGRPIAQAAFAAGVATPVTPCGPAPSVFHELPSIGAAGDTSVALNVGFDPITSRLCFVNRTLTEAPVIRVGAGHRLTFTLTNTLHDTGPSNTVNCPIDVYGGEGLCLTKRLFVEQPGADGTFYPIEANLPHTADGTTNLHVHGLLVSPRACNDEVLRSAVYPANWGGTVSEVAPCQTAPSQLTYTYDLPADHPTGLYWYHAHRHGTAEAQTQMGLVGAIVVDDGGDAYRRDIGVTDEILIVTDRPRTGCIVGPECDGVPVATRLAAAKPVVRAAATPATAPGLDPRIDRANEAGCAPFASDATGGPERYTLALNGAPVPEYYNGAFPPDSELLHKTMRPGQRQIFRIVNAAANTALSPQLVQVQNGVASLLPLDVFARDGVGLADARGNRHIGHFDVSAMPLLLPPSGRLELVVHAPPAGATLYLQSAQVIPGCGGDQDPARRLLAITSVGTAVSSGATDDSDLLTGQASLRTYLASITATPTVHRTIVLTEYQRDFTVSRTRWPTPTLPVSAYDPTATDFFITQVASDDPAFDPAATVIRPFDPHAVMPDVVVHLHNRASVTEQWTIQNATLEAHAFHMHQVHFRDITTTTTNPDLRPVLDVINVPAAQNVGRQAGLPGAPGQVTLLMTFTRTDVGVFVYHCHILEHEDNGMMARIQVVAD